jgi:hypothetical protein
MMLKHVAKPLAVTLLVCLALPGCSMFNKQRRQELAYLKYMRKNIRARQRQILRSQKAALRNAKKQMVPSEPKVSATVESVPKPVPELNPILPATPSEPSDPQPEP